MLEVWDVEEHTEEQGGAWPSDPVTYRASRSKCRSSQLPVNQQVCERGAEPQ